jgi:phosphonoacetate hydrolase
MGVVGRAAAGYEESVQTASIVVNSREYRLPVRPTAVITVDGCGPAYLDDALARGLMPRLRAMLAAGGAYALGRGQMPSFTNPNNLSIVTGAPPSVHGVPGNHYRGPGGEEVPLVDPAILRAPSIHSTIQRAGVPVLAVTAKDKLRHLLASGGVPCASAERAHERGLPEYGIDDVCALVGRPNPGVYDWDCSHYALEMGLAVHRHLQRGGRRATGSGHPAGGPGEPGLGLLYVSTTDFVQHKEGPGGAMADRFYRRFDELLGDYLDAGFVLGITADHGMNPKQNADRSPRVQYLEEALAAGGLRDCHVVLPITDPYTVHHGALGSFAWIYTARAEDLPRARELCTALHGVEEVYTREEAAVIYRHPPDRIGDLSVAADADTALGKTRAKHDLSLVATGLRTHGGRHEQIVPIIVSHPLTDRYAAWQRSGVQNSDLHDLLLNGVAT